MEYVYKPDGRVASIAHGDQAGSASYMYDRRGLREAAFYDGGVESSMRYDATGNLTHYIVESPAGKHSQEYELGDYNEVLRIRNGGDTPGPDVTFRYDEAGRAFAMQVGSRSSTASYDALDRVTRVTLDGEAVVDYAYDALDEDVVAAADRRTGETLAPFGLSPVFGTMNSVVHARPRLATHAAVAYSPALKTFEATWRHLVPDALLLAGLRRRDLPVRGEAPNPLPFGHDRPSNSLFLPPEYRSVNCHVCSASVQGVSVIVRNAVKGETATVDILINGACRYEYGNNGPAGGSGSSFYQSGSWGHTLSYGDGTAASTFPSTGVGVQRSHVFEEEDTYEVKDEVDCGACASPVALGEGTAIVTVEAPCDPGAPPSYEAETPAVEEQDSVIAGGYAWGATFVDARSDILTCAEVCANDTYRILGNAVAGAWASATTRIHKLDDCISGTRERANVIRTVAHEYHHLSTRINLANDLQARQDYRTMEACNDGLKALKSEFKRAYGAESKRQNCHRDPYFQNEYIYGRYCPPAKNKDNPEVRSTQEVITNSLVYGVCSNL